MIWTDGSIFLIWAVHSMPDNLGSWMSINTTYQGQEVQMSATFQTLPAGLNYMNYATVEVPAQQLQLMVQNFDFVPN